MTNDKLKRRIHTEIEKATVKILLVSKVREYSLIGTGFFISSNQVLTAYHCIGDYTPNLVVESPFEGKFSAHLDKEKSLRNSELDIAILKVNSDVSHYLPLGFISKQNVTDEIVAVGYPAGDIPGNEKIGFYSGTITKVREDNKFENDAMKGEGQSGGPVYHYASGRVVGLATSVYEVEKIVNAGLATRFEPLFEGREALEVMNQKSAKRWDEYLAEVHNEKRIAPKKNTNFWLLLVVILAVIGWFYHESLISPKRYTVKLFIPSSMNNAEILVDGKPANITDFTLTSKTIEVEQKESNHVISVKTEDRRPCIKELLVSKNGELYPCQ
jgi:hypothetical protein